MTNKYHNMSNSQLYKALDGAIIDSETGIREACRIIAELRKRGETIPLNTSSGVFRYWREINAEQLSPSAVWQFVTFPKLLALMINVPLDKQRSFAEGLKVDVAAINENGEIAATAKDFRSISANMHDVVIAPDGRIRSAEEQGEILLERKAEKDAREAAKPPKIRAAKFNDFVTINGVDIPCHELAEALRECGYTVERKQRASSGPWADSAAA